MCTSIQGGDPLSDDGPPVPGGRAAPQVEAVAAVAVQLVHREVCGRRVLDGDLLHGAVVRD